MNQCCQPVRWLFILLAVASVLVGPALADQPASPGPQGQPEPPVKVYVPYDKLRGVFENEKQGVFLPFEEFQRLWKAAQGQPADVNAVPTPYVLSTARLTGKVGKELATLQLELTIDVLTDEWVDIPLGLGEVAVVKVAFDEQQAQRAKPLLRVENGSYQLLTRGRGRCVLKVDFVRQLLSRPGLNVLSFRAPPASITTLDLLIPEENIKVDVWPMLAATTAAAEQDGRKVTRLQTFLGAGGQVQLSWKPSTQAAEELEPVIIADQLGHIHVDEAVATWTAQLNYDIRRRGVDKFTISLPGSFRVTSVEGANISKWDITGGPATQPDDGRGRGRTGSQEAEPQQVLTVKLFSPVKDRYGLVVRMERFLQDDQAELALPAIVTHEAVRHSGLLAVSPSPRRSVELRDVKNLARVEVGRLPDSLRNVANIVNYRFISTDYSARLAVATVQPRVSANFAWSVGVQPDRMELHGLANYQIERVGVFQAAMSLPEPWEIDSVGPAGLVERHEVTGQGASRRLNVLFRQEQTGGVTLDIRASARRAMPDAPVDFRLPMPALASGGPAGESDLKLFAGSVCLLLGEQLRAELDSLDQLAAAPLNEVSIPQIGQLSAAMAYRFRAIDQAKPAGAKFRIAVKPPQVSATVHRLVNIQPGTIQDEAVIVFNVRYAPVDTFYVYMPPRLADGGVEIAGSDIKETPRLPDVLPPATMPAGADRRRLTPWASYKVVLQSPVMGEYRLTVSARRAFQPAASGAASMVPVDPILAGGELSDQNGFVAIVKADTLALGEPKANPAFGGADNATDLISGDPGSANDLPHQPHRDLAPTLAFRYSTPPFSLALPVAAQKEADVFTVIATAAIIEQVLARDGTLNGQATFLLSASRGDRLVITLPQGAARKLYEVKLDGRPTQIEEVPGRPNERVVRLPATAGQVKQSVLQISYGLDAASAGSLAAPALPADVPVRQTVWRLWSPQDDRLLRIDRSFARLGNGEADKLLENLSAGQPAEVKWAFAGQGRSVSLMRPGAPGTLSVWRVGNEALAIVTWLVVLLVGVLLLRVGGYGRCLAAIVIAAAAMVVDLFAPLLVESVGEHIAGPLVLVALVWLVQWIFVRLRRRQVEQRLVGSTATDATGPANEA